MFSLRTMRSIRSFFPVLGCRSPRFDKTSWPLYCFHDGSKGVPWLLSQHSMMLSLRTAPSIFPVLDSSIRRIDNALWAVHWFHDSNKLYFARSLPISSLLFLRNRTNKATLKKVNLKRSEPHKRIFEPHEMIFEPRKRMFAPRKRRIESRFPWAVWLLDMNQPTVETRFLMWGATDEIGDGGSNYHADVCTENPASKPRSNHEFQNATDLTCRCFDTSNQHCIINSEETPVKAVMNKLIEGVYTNCHEAAKTDLVAIHEVNRLSARSRVKSQFRQKQRDRKPSRVRVNRLVGLLSKRKSTEHSKNMMKNCFPKSSEIHSVGKNYKDFRVNFLRRRYCFFTAYFINLSRQCWAHSNRKVISSHAIGRKRTNNNYCNDRSNSKKNICQISNISHPTVIQQSTPVTACNYNKNTRYNESKKKIMLSGDIELNPGPTPVNHLNEESACFHHYGC